MKHSMRYHMTYHMRYHMTYHMRYHMTDIVRMTMKCYIIMHNVTLTHGAAEMC